MDSRDIKENPVIHTGFLEDMYKMQKNLIDHYIKIEGLPQYPINVNKKSNQVILKDFTGRVIEELAEGMESLMIVRQNTLKNRYWLNNYNNDEYNNSLNHLQNFGEELADAIHFYLELLIFANIGVEDLLGFVESKYKQKPQEGEDALNFLKYIGHKQYVINRYYQNMEPEPLFNHVNVLKPIEDKEVEIKDDIRYYQAGSKINIAQIGVLKKVLWDITYHMNIARNFLKNKPWKQSQMMTSEIQYQEELVHGFLNFLGFLQMTVVDAEQIYFLYFKKNHINQFRIKTKY